MFRVLAAFRTALLGSAALAALGLQADSAIAGGFAVREQSAYAQGSSFAGAAANNTLSAMFWNAAAAANLQGLNAESNYSLIIPQADINVVTGPAPFLAGDRDADIGILAIVPASYLNYQFKDFDPRLFLGLGINSGFGLKTKPDDTNYAGSVLGRTSSLFTVNVNPTLAYQVTPTLALGVGLQVQYSDGQFKFATGSPTGPNSFFDGNGFAVGATAGLMWTPTTGTRVGLGWRSALDVELDGRFATNGGASLGLPAAAAAAIAAGPGATVDLKLPDIVTLSIQQAVTSNMRVLATVEWTNWSRFEELRVVGQGNGLALLPTGAPSTAAPGTTLGVIDAKWHDGWYAALGFEYDYSNKLTLRTGIAYEWSPIQNPTERIIGIPDANRIWLSAGATYNWSQATSIDLAYTHIFVEDATWDRTLISSPTTRLTGTLDASADIVSAALRTKF